MTEASYEDLKAEVTEVRHESEKDRDRLTATMACHHQAFGESPVSFNGAFSDYLETKEFPFVDRLQVGEDPMLLHTGRLADASAFIIENLVGKKRQTIPSEEEFEEDRKKILKLRFEGCSKFWLVRPGRFHFGEPSDIDRLEILSAHGVIPAKLWVFPK